jgi:hypothetical protein
MLFGYPIEATNENWFHECMIAMLQTIHESILNGQGIPLWPEIIPLPYRKVLKRKTGLRSRLQNYQREVLRLSNDQLRSLIKAISEQNDIVHLLSGERNCGTIEELTTTIRQPIRELFEFGFDLLADLGIRDRQYQIIFNATPFHICPFCGYEYFDGPGAPREPLDHYLAKSKYPFAAVNPRNLVPMGGKCNSKYKLAKDILYKEDGTRRKVVDPYNCKSIQLSLKNSKPFEGNHAIFPLPLWLIEFEPITEELSTWDSVFDIKQRYQRDVLDADFMSMLREFSIYCMDRKVRAELQEEVIQALKNFSDYWKEMGMKDKAFIKAAVFEMLFLHCQQGNQRLSEIVSSVVIGGMSLNA